jgi:queuine tRNA-ribosyltransferase
MNLYPNFSFDITHKDTKTNARLGKINTPHGSVETPNFIFCGTKATIKNLSPRDFANEGTQIILANTYHLMLNGGADLMEKFGGIHKLMGWNGPILTDSGGFQVFSFGHGTVADEIKGRRNDGRKSMICKIREEGVEFYSYIDGSKRVITPEISIQTQQKIGADLILMFDECTPFNVEKEYTENSMHLSHRWGKRSLEYFIKHNDHRQALYGIVQGGIYEDLRKQSVEFVNSEDFFGIAVGGSLGQNKEQMHSIVNMTMENVRRDRPVHLLGIGGFSDIINGVECGIDTFDCVHPTRIARHGCAIVRPDVYRKYNNKGLSKEFISLKNAIFKNSYEPIDSECQCYTCQNFSGAYLHYLIKANENLFMSLLSIHNIRQMNNLMLGIRNGLKNDEMDIVKKKWIFC